MPKALQKVGNGKKWMVGFISKGLKKLGYSSS
jgi:hypothetical protein